MQKKCICGECMNSRLRTVIYSNKVEIENVPIYSCESCNRNEVFQEVKPDLTMLIGGLGAAPDKQSILFNEWNELSYLILQASLRDRAHQSLESIIDERINHLLDLLLLAQSLNDDKWLEDVQRRLKQITDHAMHTYDLSAE